MPERAYRDRRDAGETLAAAVVDRLGPVDAVVLALPRGGVPVGLVVARGLDAPLDVMVVRKLGVPGQPELAMGAIAAEGFKVLDESLVAQLQLTNSEVAAVVEHETKELQRREALYRAARSAVEVRGRVAVLVDDGLATGSTMRAAIRATRGRGPAKLVVAVPVGARDTCAELARKVDTFICPLQPGDFFAVGQWYQDFAPTTDDEVRACLAAAPHPEKAA
jgi:predicted phosphoribosyltransferase